MKEWVEEVFNLLAGWFEDNSDLLISLCVAILLIAVVGCVLWGVSLLFAPSNPSIIDPIMQCTTVSEYPPISRCDDKERRVSCYMTTHSIDCVEMK